MKKIILFILSMLAFISVEAKTTFKVEGPHNVYRRIRVINQTSQENFDCRFVLLKENEDGSLTRGEVYGIYHLKGRNDIDTNTRWIDKGTLVGIEMPAGFPEDVEVSVEYNSVAIRVTLLDKNSKFESF
ncbi:MAG: hypothetical protein UE068_02065 [Paludibacteraceae bacterium]|jgi:hypothetical protein|nr:hypothetical protein [Paludibacteraceae bacterium]